MRLILDMESPVPLYHQITEAISYRIATGRLSSGDTVPSVREAAKAWGVNMHTVRRAYAKLVDQGLLESRGALGTRVRIGVNSGMQQTRADKIGRFIASILSEAREQHGVTPHELVNLISNWSPVAQGSQSIVYVVECSETECTDHAKEIESAWHVTAKPWCLSQQGEPPLGQVVATYFHYNEIRRRWTYRFHDIRFIAIHPDPKLALQLLQLVGKNQRLRLKLCEYEESKALNIAADLSMLLPPDRFRIEPHVVENANEFLKPSKVRTPVLFSPRVWDALTHEEQAHPRAFKVLYVVAQEELDALGQHFGWRRRRG